MTIVLTMINFCKKAIMKQFIKKKLKQLIIKVFKCLNGESPEILNGIFARKNITHNLRINNLLKLPSNSNTITNGLHSFGFRGSATWNALPDDYKNCKSSSVLKQHLRNHNIKCSCKLCMHS